ncbi:hypothetical protein CC86DRAFT_130994 [Ophiobolus disseminans]|uniref:IgE-binding protein n=1 Tax=Ophiobolus disseminans TaxID=1469910 RepID=A0A6A6ZF98_9PLEO|nr:hypothetical protein CC86DRAFT_130994 [Ophiobolus disseminans]
MKYTITALALVGAVFAGACPKPSPSPTPSPTPEGPSYFGVISARSASPIHLRALTARGGKFYLGGPGPSSYCPVAQVGAACPPGNETVLAGGYKTLSLGVIVPGGQQVYVAPDGALSYTGAHSAYIPPGSIVDGFSREAPAAGAQFGVLNFDTGFVACPAAAADQGYQVFGQVDGATFGDGCLGFNALAVAGDKPGAWQY